MREHRHVVRWEHDADLNAAREPAGQDRLHRVSLAGAALCHRVLAPQKLVCLDQSPMLSSSCTKSIAIGSNLQKKTIRAN